MDEAGAPPPSSRDARAARAASGPAASAVGGRDSALGARRTLAEDATGALGAACARDDAVEVNLEVG
ncbi:hypothetical protein [Sorangium sp. So ce341]|uniref:hypothetical protein n=1 Tax=Sorangium sp. So ce341 TaxID=3133302 RepID=UPI003F600694